MSVKAYPLQERTKIFAISVISLVRGLKVSHLNSNIIQQLLRSSSSVGANYYEASETDTKKDFANKIRIARKEAKESVYWCDLLIEAVGSEHKQMLMEIKDESVQLVKILAAIYEKSK